MGILGRIGLLEVLMLLEVLGLLELLVSFSFLAFFIVFNWSLAGFGSLLLHMLTQAELGYAISDKLSSFSCEEELEYAI
ncbi:hypothetical protein BC351_21740 [Paenibacillus ferrarius]|uniref:Uncharacterized protein n=1 Tax=Paenibacillus ferrarius TaxID=1469647 RepID=A0A1V4HNZ1_9BACL|nr:hypothetical protein BC351_21740 [Paenibacillus ferrarius]